MQSSKIQPQFDEEKKFDKRHRSILVNLVNFYNGVERIDSPIPTGSVSTYIYPQELLHKNITKNSEKLKSAQGSVFYVKLQQESQTDKEFVLKVYRNRNSSSFDKELAVLNALRSGFMSLDQSFSKECMNPYNSMFGFPDVISVMRSQEQ